MMQINDILKKIYERGLFKGVKRYFYKGYNLEYALQVVEAIGKSRNPKFVIDNENRFTYENLVRWVFGDTEMKCLDPETREVVPGRLTAGIYIAGNTGSGKSWALEIMTAFATIDNVQIFIGEGNRCLHWNNFRADTICEEYQQTGLVERYKQNSIIGIQDLASEPTESLYMGNRMNVIKQVLEYRGDRTDRVTLITSNIPISHKRLVELYGDRVTSRLTEMCNYFEIKGKDRRKL